MSRPRWSRFAPWGLYLALLGLLASFGLFFVQRVWNFPLQLSLALVILGLALFAILDPERGRSIILGRQVRSGRNSLVVTLGFLGILGVINFLVYQNPHRWDMTDGAQQSLAPQTIDTLTALDEPVMALAFYGALTPSDQARQLLENYHYYSGGGFNFEFIDPETDPVIVEQANITHDPTIVLQMGERQEQVTYPDEQALTGALIRLMSPGDRVVYFLIGHGEHDISGVGDKAFSVIRKTLEAKNYTVLPLNLLAENQIPEDARAIVIGGPSQPLSVDETHIVSLFLQSGGGLVVMEEPLPLTDFGQAEDPLAGYLDSNWGIVLGKDLIVDLSSNKPFTAVANQYGSHLITQKMQGLVTFFPDARSVTISREVPGVIQVDLVQTASQSWAESDLEAVSSGAEIAPDEGTDTLGPVSLAVAAENSESGGRLVVFGDSDFATDARFNAYGNGDLFINALDWVAERDELISLTPKETTQRILVPPRPVVLNLIVLALVFVVPGFVILLGGVTWYRRRLAG